MDIEDLRRLRPALDGFVGEFDDCIRTAPSRRLLLRYVNGQLGPLERKSIEPMALELGVPPRTLQEFLSIHRWDEGAVGRRLRQLTMRDHADPNAIGIIDESSFRKKGDRTPGVQRQYCGTSGKIENSVVTVHLGYVAGDFHALIDSDLFLPEETWSNDRSRCRAAKIPDDVVYRPKWKIALELFHRAIDDGVRFRWLTADEFYGRSREFRDTISAAGVNYVVEIPNSLTGWSKRPVVRGERRARPVSKLWKRGGPSWVLYRIKNTDKGPEVWKVRETPFYPRSGAHDRALRLIIATNVLSAETKYFLSDASPDVPLATLLYVAFSRWHIERLFEDGKGEVGLDHFEVRNYRSLMRHLVISNVSLYFLSEQTELLREKKPLVDPLPDQGRDRGPTGPGDVSEGTEPSSQQDRGHHRVLATPSEAGGSLPPQAETA
jgi:SRSO17 transposase